MTTPALPPGDDRLAILPDWSPLTRAALPDDCKAVLNRTHAEVDARLDRLVAWLCRAHDGHALAPEAIDEAAALLAAVRGLPFLI